jgi:hypothetical protein
MRNLASPSKWPEDRARAARIHRGRDVFPAAVRSISACPQHLRACRTQQVETAPAVLVAQRGDAAWLTVKTPGQVMLPGMKHLITKPPPS